MPASRSLSYIGSIVRPGRFSRDQRRKRARRTAQVAAIRASALFDAKWYLARYPEVQREGIDPAVHYALHGGPEGRWPHPLFHGDFYLAHSPEVRDQAHNPLLHYIEHGAREGRNPNPLFDTHWYAETYMEGGQNTANPLAHFLAQDDAAPSLRFNAAWYATQYLGGSARPADALIHYFTVGRELGHYLSPTADPYFVYAKNKVAQSGLFDPDFYLSLSPDVAKAGMDPLDHYMLAGAHESRRPHPLFDVDWYILEQQPKLDVRRINPVLHYLEQGAASGRDPSPWFNTAWYAAHHPDCLTAYETPLSHFLQHGHLGLAPSIYFDGAQYLRENEDVARSGANPLSHYLTAGIREGRVARLVDPQRHHRSVADADLVCLKAPTEVGPTVALMVTHAPNGRLKGHVERYIRACRAQGIDVVLIAAADRRKTAIPESVIELCTGVFVRQNRGFDFAAWAHILLIQGNLLNCDCLILTNDSILGPLDDKDFAALVKGVREDEADLVGTTDNFHYAWHLQSFFLACKRRVLTSYAFAHYLTSIVNLTSKNHVISMYELTFTLRMRAAGFATKALFPMAPTPEAAAIDPPGNRTIFQWDRMLRLGFPFMKASLVVGEHRKIGGEAVRTALAERGFDLDSLEPTYQYPGPKIWADLDGDPAGKSYDTLAYFGPTDYANGLGVAARSYLRALYRLPRPVNVHATTRDFYVHARVAPDWQVAAFSGMPDIAVVHVNGDGWEPLLDAGQKALVAGARRRIGLLVWETSVVPLSWLPTIDRLDAIWTPSTYCAEIFRSVTDVPIHVIPHVVQNEEPERVDGNLKAQVRRAYGLDPKRRIILYAFDGSSFLARKNPFSLIRAFRAANLHRNGWQLVLKTKHLHVSPDKGRSLFEAVGAGASDVALIDRPMSDLNLQALFDLAEIYASSHSSEGFGLTIAEAMERGKVVVATDYGGSRDFLDASCGFPVRADVVPLAESYGPYLRGSAWGLVDEADLARALREAAAAVEQGKATAIGAAAQARIRSLLSSEAVARAMETSLAELETIWTGKPVRR